MGTSLVGAVPVEPPVAVAPPDPVTPPVALPPPDVPPVEAPPLALSSPLASNAGCWPLLAQATTPATKNVAKNGTNLDV